MAVRPFYIEAFISGRETPLKGGPRNKEGHTIIKILQREKGKIVNPFTINQETYTDSETGKLMLVTEITNENGHIVDSYETEY